MESSHRPPLRRPRTRARVAALCLGLAGAAVLVLSVTPVVPLLMLLRSHEVRAVYDTPSIVTEGGSGLGCVVGGGPARRPWPEAPAPSLDSGDLDRLAADSLAWFESSPASAEWRDEPTAVLEVEYTSAGRLVTVRHRRDAATPWRERLGAWLRRFPPGGLSWRAHVADYDWTVEFGSELEVSGFAFTSEAAVRALDELASEPWMRDGSEAATFSLCWSTRRGFGTTDVCSAETTSPDEIADLPGRVAVKRAQADSLAARDARVSSRADR